MGLQVPSNLDFGIGLSYTMKHGTFPHQEEKRKTYLYVREIARVNGKPKVISQTYIGAPDRVASLVKR